VWRVSRTLPDVMPRICLAQNAAFSTMTLHSAHCARRNMAPGDAHVGRVEKRQRPYPALPCVAVVSTSRVKASPPDSHRGALGRDALERAAFGTPAEAARRPRPSGATTGPATSNWTRQPHVLSTHRWRTTRACAPCQRRSISHYASFCLSKIYRFFHQPHLVGQRTPNRLAKTTILQSTAAAPTPRRAWTHVARARGQTPRALLPFPLMFLVGRRNAGGHNSPPCASMRSRPGNFGPTHPVPNNTPKQNARIAVNSDMSTVRLCSARDHQLVAVNQRAQDLRALGKGPATATFALRRFGL